LALCKEIAASPIINAGWAPGRIWKSCKPVLRLRVAQPLQFGRDRLE
jgi:hypothetical protein